MSVPLALAALAVLPLAAGHALPVAGLRPLTRWAAGALVMGVAYSVCHVLAMPQPAAWLLLAAVLAIGMVRISRRRPWSRHTIAAQPRHEQALSAFCALLIVAGAVITLAQPVNGFDAVAAWYAKTRALLRWDAPALMPFPTYPNLGPAMWALVLEIAGTGAEPVGRLVFVVFYVSAMSALREVFPRPMSPVAAAAVAAGVLAGFEHSTITSGYQDLILAAAAALSAALLAEPLIQPESPRCRVALGLGAAGSLGFIKIEGAILGVLLIAGWALVAGRRRTGLGAALAAALALCAAWPLLARLHDIDETRVSWVHGTLSLWDLIARLDRLPAILDRWLSMRPTYWLLAAAALTLSIAAWQSTRDLRRFLVWTWVVVALHTGAIVGAFLITDAPLEWHLDTAFRRWISQHAFVWPLVIAVSAVWLAGHRPKFKVQSEDPPLLT